MRERTDACAQPLLIDVHDEVETEFHRAAVAERDHLLEFPGGVHMKKRKRRLRGPEGLHGEVQHHRAVLADGIEHHRLAELRGDFAHDVDAFRLKLGEMARLRGSEARRGWFEWHPFPHTHAPLCLGPKYVKIVGLRGAS